MLKIAFLTNDLQQEQEGQEGQEGQATSDRLDIAYFDRTKWRARFRHHTTHAGSFKNQKNAFLNDPNSRK